MINLNKLAATQPDVSDESMTEATSMTKYSIVVTRQEPQVAAELVRHSRILPRLRVCCRVKLHSNDSNEKFSIFTYMVNL